MENRVYHLRDPLRCLTETMLLLLSVRGWAQYQQKYWMTSFQTSVKDCPEAMSESDIVDVTVIVRSVEFRPIGIE